jgi:dienelactone hydrolase
VILAGQSATGPRALRAADVEGHRSLRLLAIWGIRLSGIVWGVVVAGRVVMAGAVLGALLLGGCGRQAADVEPPAPSASAVAVEAVEYDLGGATLVQQQFEEGSRFRDMPVRLNGLIAVPKEGAGPFPVVMVIHGTHPGCPQDETGVDRWPCDPQVEQANYSGFGYLLEAVASQGYVALAPNFNAEHTFGFGEPEPNARLVQLTDLHLGALAEAAAGDGLSGVPDFGVDLAGRADPGTLALIGHSRGGDAAVLLAGRPQVVDGAKGYGPVAGVLLVAAAAAFGDPWAAIDVPVATVLAGCDGDVLQQSGQFFYEGPRLAPDQTQWVASTFLEGATHNAFNTILGPDMAVPSADDRPDCQPLLDAERQRAWLAQYATDFLALLRAEDPGTVARIRADLGLDSSAPAPDAVLGLPARVAYLPPAADRTVLMAPSSEAELSTNRLGVTITAESLDLLFCPKGFFTLDMEPGSEACHRQAVTVPGQPAHAVLTWQTRDAALRLAIPDDAGILSDARSLSLRAAVDPASALNEPGTAQALTVQLTDRAGNQASVTTRPDEPALGHPAGEMRADEFSPDFFTGIVALTTIRIPLAQFSGIDTSAIREVTITPTTARGALFLADVELTR